MPSSLFPIAPSEHSAPGVLEAQAQLLEAMPAVARVLNAIPAMVMILNRERQVVLANRSLIEFVEGNASEVRGRRPGELLECVHANELGLGCGATESCTVCGAMRAILTAQLGRSQSGSCRIQRRVKGGEETLQLEISATPFDVSGQMFTLLHLVNATDRVHRQWFENAVAPQALALATELEVLASTLASPAVDPSIRGETGISLLASSRRLTALLREQREMAEAIAGDCRGPYGEISTLDLLSGAAREIQTHDAAQKREVRLDPSSEDLRITTDRKLTLRVLTKLLLNALEATRAGGAVTLGCRTTDDGKAVELWIRNAGLIPRPVQLQIFQSAFSTKGLGRGYGTHFAKLMTERCLGGTVSFESNVKNGTIFRVRLPLTPPPY